MSVINSIQSGVSSLVINTQRVPSEIQAAMRTFSQMGTLQVPLKAQPFAAVIDWEKQLERVEGLWNGLTPMQEMHVDRAFESWMGVEVLTFMKAAQAKAGPAACNWSAAEWGNWIAQVEKAQFSHPVSQFSRMIRKFEELSGEHLLGEVLEGLSEISRQRINVAPMLRQAQQGLNVALRGLSAKERAVYDASVRFCKLAM